MHATHMCESTVSTVLSVANANTEDLCSLMWSDVVLLHREAFQSFHLGIQCILVNQDLLCVLVCLLCHLVQKGHGILAIQAGHSHLNEGSIGLC